MTRLLLGLLAAAFLVTLTPTAQAQYTAQVRRQLDAAGSTLSREGYSRSHDYEIDNLDDDAEDSFTLTLTQGREYAIVGACDNDCSDIDFWLYDENDNLVDSDTSTDDIPIVRVTPRWTGTFRIRVKMFACSAEPCYYGIGVFGD